MSNNALVGCNAAQKLKDVELVVKRELSGSEKQSLEKGYGCTVYILRGHTVIKGEASQLKALPQETLGKNAYFRREITAESGGAMTSSGSATIYSDLAGQPLEKFRLITSGVDKHSYGYAKIPLDRKVIRIEAAGDRRTCNVVVLRETVNAASFTIDSEKIWEAENLEAGSVAELIPRSFERFAEAVEAAIGKANCYHCHCTHFY